MPFKSEKQRKWMYANDPEMAKKWEKEESIKGKLRNLIKQEIKSVNEGFDKYHLGGLLDSKLKKRLERAIKIWGGKVDAVGDDYIKFRLSSFEVAKFPALLKKLDRNKNVWIGDKRKNNIWDRRQKINKLEAFRPKGVSFMKKIVLLPKSKLYFDPSNGNFWLMGPGGEPDWEDDPIEPKDRDYKRTLSRLSSKDKSIMKKSLRGSGNWKEATTSVSVPGYLSPQAFKKSTQNAIDVDDEDDEKKESMAAPFRRRKSRGLGRPMKVGLNERKLSSHQKKAILIAIEMSGNMTGATKKIERIKKGLSNDKKVKDALRLANESINEGKWSKIMRSVRKGSKSGPWTIVVYKGKKVLHQRRVKILQQIPAHYEDVLNLKDLARGIKIGIEDKYGERVYTESVNSIREFSGDQGINVYLGGIVNSLQKAGIKAKTAKQMKHGFSKSRDKIGFFIDVLDRKREKYTLQLEIDRDGYLWYLSAPKDMKLGKWADESKVVRSLKAISKLPGFGQGSLKRR